MLNCLIKNFQFAIIFNQKLDLQLILSIIYVSACLFSQKANLQVGICAKLMKPIEVTYVFSCL